MSKLDDFCKYVEDTGLLGVSGATFKDHETPTGLKFKANTDPRKYCIDMGEFHGISGEEYAGELLSFITAPSERIDRECKKCFKMLTEFESNGHYCNGEGRVDIGKLTAGNIGAGSSSIGAGSGG